MGNTPRTWGITFTNEHQTILHTAWQFPSRSMAENIATGVFVCKSWQDTETFLKAAGVSFDWLITDDQKATEEIRFAGIETEDESELHELSKSDLLA